MKLEGSQEGLQGSDGETVSDRSSQVPEVMGWRGGWGWEDLELGTNRQEVEVGLLGGGARPRPPRKCLPAPLRRDPRPVAHRTPWPSPAPEGAGAKASASAPPPGLSRSETRVS